IMPSTLSILTATFRDPKERPKAIAIWVAAFPLGMGSGPLISGALLDHFWWGSVFVINIPVVIFALIGGYFFVEESKDEKSRKADIPGVILSIAGLFALVYGIIRAGEESWSDGVVLISLGVSVVLLAAFAWWQSYNPNPMLPLKFFRNMSFTGANMALTLVMFSMFGTFFFMTQYFQT
ncbi:MAG: MFS transporter, partial [bacterium]|nr:MFS transporter [bacterium]